jgi:hypothetical protein
VVSWPLKRFFNIGEGHIPKEFDWSDFSTLEKLDGSLIHFWHHDQQGWQCGTRSVPDAETGLDDTGMTFKQLVLRTIEDMGSDWQSFTNIMEPGYTFVFELTTRENQVVCEYQDRRLTLLGIRNLHNLKERDVHAWHEQNCPPFPVVQKYPGWTLEEVQATVRERDPKAHEGYVLVDNQFNRVKIKSEAYCFMSSRRDGLGKSNKTRIALIQADAVDDVLSSLPDHVQQKILDLQRKLVALVKTCDALFDTVRYEEIDKDFAMKVQHSGYSAIMFAIRRGKAFDAWDFFKNATPKRVLEYLDEEDEEEQA